jgi:hypothetical protein
VHLALHGLSIQFSVRLRPRPPNGRPLRSVQQPKLNACLVRDTPHDAVEGIDLAHQMTLAKTADGGVARHLADRIGALGDQSGLGAKARRRSRSVTASVPPTYNDDIKIDHLRSDYFGSDSQISWWPKASQAW